MDPLSLTASIIAVVGAGGSLVKAFRKLLSIKDAPVLLLRLRDEVSDTSRVISCIADCYRDQDEVLTSCEPQASLVCTRLARAKQIVLEVEKLVAYELTKVVNGADTVASTAWLRKENKVQDLLDRLQHAKRDLEIILGFLNFSSTRRLKALIERILHQGQPIENHVRTTLHIDGSGPFGHSPLQPLLNSTATDVGFPSSTTTLQPQESAIAQISTETTCATRYLGGDIQLDVSGSARCNSLCSCTCHHISQIRSPKMFDILIGSLSIIYRYAPSAAQRCNTANCRPKTISSSTIRYSLPQWFAHRIVSAIALYEQHRGLELRLRVLNRRPYSSEFYQAVKFGRVEKVQNLLASGSASVFDIDGFGKSVLQWGIVAIANEETMLKCLLDNGADMMQEDDYGRTAYMEAWSLDVPSIDIGYIPHSGLFGRKVDYEQLGWHELQAAVVELDPQSFNSLIDTVPRSSVDVRDRNGRTALSIAAENADIEKIRRLLQKGANPGTIDKIGQTPLQHWAYYCLDDEVDRLLDLLDVTAYINKADVFGYTAFHSAIQCSSSSLQTLKALKDRGADINSSDNYGFTPLHDEIRRKHSRFGHIEWLIENGANISAQDCIGRNPLLLALKYNRHHSLKLLLNARSDYTLKTSDNESVLHMAALFADIRSVKILQQACLNIRDPQSEDVYHCTPMYLALFRRNNNEGWAYNSDTECDENPEEWFQAFEAMYQDIEQRSHELESNDGNEERAQVDIVDELMKALPGSYPDD